MAAVLWADACFDSLLPLANHYYIGLAEIRFPAVVTHQGRCSDKPVPSQ
jgi:hypothetical protein